MEDQNGNFEMNDLNSSEEKIQNVFRLESNREYEATFSFIDDESNRIFIHLEKFTENLQQIEVRIISSRIFITGAKYDCNDSYYGD